MAGQREYEMLFKLNAQMSGSYSSAFRSAQNSMSQFQSAYRALKQEQGDISGFQRQQTAVENTKSKLEMLQQQYDNIQREMQETGTYSSDLENKLLSKKAQIDKTTQALEQQIDKLNAYKQKLEEAGIDTSDLETESARLKQELENLKKSFEEAGGSSQNFGDKAVNALSEIETLFVSAGITKALQAIYDEFKECASAAIDFEQGMAGVRRTVGGSEEEIAELGEAFKEMSTQMPITTSELASIATTAGQLGIARENVEVFTQVMAMLATTTDLTAENAATMLAQFSNITGTTDYERLGAVVAALGDSTATTASKIVDMSTGISGTATIAGLSEREILAISAAVGSLGEEAAAGSTSMSQLIQRLYKATETGDSLEEFAAVAGMSASEFKTAWGQDAMSALVAFIRGLNDTERNGKSAIVVLDELGITNIRQSRALLKLANNTDLLTSSVELANTAWEENTALTEKAGIMYGTTQAQITMAQNSVNNLKIEIGNAFTPAINKMYQLVASLCDSIATFVAENPKVVKAIAALVTGFASFVAIVMVAKVVMIAFNAICSANPILLVAAAAVSLITALVTLVATEDDAEESTERLSAASQAQADHIAELNEEYANLVASGQEMSTEAQLLKSQIEEETEAFEEQKQTFDEVISGINEASEAFSKNRQEQIDNAAALDTELEGNLNLISTLEELTSAENQTAESKEKILAIVNLLNERIPELGLNYSSLTGSLNMTPEEVKGIVYQQYLMESNSNNVESMKTAYGEREGLKQKVETAQSEYDNALKEYNDANNAYMASKAMGGVLADSSARDAGKEKLDAATQALDNATRAYEENEQVINDCANAIAGYSSEQENAAETTDTVSGTLSEAKYKLDSLADAYTNAYKAALESIQGQFELWEDVPEVVATGVDTATENLANQEQYWNDYQSNLEILLDKSKKIPGLSEVVASFANGSAEGINMIAGMADSSKEELQTMVDQWNRTQESQQAAADALGQLVVDYPNKLDEIITTTTGKIEKLDVSDEAATAGANTIQGYIDGAEGMLDAVVAAYTSVGEAAKTALENAISVGDGGNTPGHATGTAHAKRGFAVVGEEGPELVWFNGGEKVSTAHETEAIRRNSEFYDFTAAEPVAAAPNYSNSNSIIVNFAPVYQLSGAMDTSEVRAILAEHDAEMIQQIKDTLDDIREDEGRRAYV
ncbi:MAG: phage tail tape measure protein [Faecousia sp.]